MRTVQPNSGMATQTTGPGASLLIGLLTGAAVGLIGALATAPLRRLADVSDRAVVNGVSVAGGAIVLWLLLGGLHAALRANPSLARRAVLTGAAVVAIVGAVLLYTALRDYALRLPSLALPLLLWVTIVGAALFLALIAIPLRLPLRMVAPAAFVAALTAGGLVAALDREPGVHYTLSKLPAATSAATSGSVAPAGAAASPSTATGPLHFSVTTGSEAAYTVNEKLTRLPAPSDAVGKTQAISGDVYVTPGQGLTKTPASTITIDLTTLTSDSPMRDGFIKRSTLQTDQFPRAIYTVTGIDGFPASYHEGDEVKVTVNGTLQVHGVEKPVAWTGTARYAGQQLEAVLSADVTMTMFGMTPPQVPIVQSVDDKVHLDLHLVLQQQAA